jgi:hypothetical protein
MDDEPSAGVKGGESALVVLLIGLAADIGILVM